MKNGTAAIGAGFWLPPATPGSLTRHGPRTVEEGETQAGRRSRGQGAAARVRDAKRAGPLRTSPKIV